MLSFDFQRDSTRVSAGSNNKVVFELTLVAVIDQVNSGIDVLVPHLGVRGNIRSPLLGIIADEVVGNAGQFTLAHHRRFSVRAHKTHAHCGWRRRLGAWVSGLVSSNKVVGTEEKLFELEVFVNRRSGHY